MPNAPIIPRPIKLEESGGSFTLDESSRILAPEALMPEAALLAVELRRSTGFALPVSSPDSRAEGAVLLSLSDDLKPEAYRMTVTPKGVDISAGGRAGAFYGTRTLLQLLPSGVFRDAPVSSGGWTVPCLRVEDEPRFRWRGMHLDCARHFMPKEFVKKFIDLLALHKMNIFHWHLTEDQGWRLPVEAYPRLAEVAAWREETVIGHHNNKPRLFDGRRHGGFYSRDDVREIVAYAAMRHVTVVPEIEMPGHSQAVLAAYPEFGCTGGPYAVRTVWAISDDVFCAGNDKVFEFLFKVLEETLDLFPGEFIHIGGDECPKARWKECPKCQARIKAEGLADEHELQSYFIRRIGRFLEERGRRLIGWDEILEGGLAPGATVMSWRGTEGGIKAARAGHDVVFASNTHTYFDHCQSDDPFAEPLAIGGFLPLRKVYEYEPVPEGFTVDEAAHVLGGQAQLWSEYMPTPKHVEYMAFPRQAALSEVLWSPAEGKDYEGFLQRLGAHLGRLDALDVRYRPLDRA